MEKLGYLILIFGWLLSASANAGSVDYLNGAEKVLPYQPMFRFQHEKVSLPGNPTAHPDFLFGDGLDTENLVGQPNKKLYTYDAAITYPVWKQGVALDVGLNIKVFDGQAMASSIERRGIHNFRAAIPMIYATALLDLPFKGLEAGFEGSFSDLDTQSLSDYRAKLRYSMDNGLGIEGGWRHQQIRVDESAEGDFNYEHNGPFFDLFYRF